MTIVKKMCMTPPTFHDGYGVIQISKIFEHKMGSDRYRWLHSLGNLAVRAGGPMRIRIKDPGSFVHRCHSG
jgi:hypothetical protein